MREIYNYTWVFSFLGVIFVIIAFLSPAATYVSENSIYFYWIWDLYAYETSYDFTFELDMYIVNLLPSIVCSLIILSATAWCIVSINKARKGMKELGIYPQITIIICTIFWIIVTELSYIVHYDESFWDNFNPSFGTIGMLIGAGIMFAGYGINKIYEKTKKEIDIAPQKQISVTSGTETTLMDTQPIQKNKIMEYVWVMPLLGGIISLIAFFTPAAFVEDWGGYLYTWMWEINSVEIYDP